MIGNIEKTRINEGLYMKEMKKKQAGTFYMPLVINKGILVKNGKDKNTDVLFENALKYMTPVKVR